MENYFDNKLREERRIKASGPARLQGEDRGDVG